MAEIFKNPELIITPSVNAPSAGGKEHTGNSEIDSYLNSLPEDEREEALLAITAPKTGEDIHNEMNETGVDPSKEDWLKLNQFYRTRDTDYLKVLSENAGHIYDIFGNAMSSVKDDPSLENLGKVTPSVFEGATQNLRGLYGIVAESVDSTSPQSKFFNILNNRTEDSDEAYRVFLQARQFTRESQAYADGTKTILFDKEHLNNDFVQAAGLVADPLMFVPFGKAFTLAGGVLGMSERSMALAARTANLKNRILGGSLKYGVGMPIEFIGKGTRVTLDHAIATGEKAFMAATGVSSETFREGMRMSGVGSLGAGYFGHSVPLLTNASGAYVAGTAAAGVGEAVSIVGHQIMKGERGIASYAKQALIDSTKQGVELSGHSKALLKIIDGFDPLIDYTTTVAQGAAHGSVIGAGLGYWSGGEEGLASGIGAGIALGSVGGTAGKLLADVTGRTYKHRTSIQAKLVIEGLRDIHPEQAQSWERAQAWAKARNFSIDGIIAAKDTIHPNTHIEVLTNREYAGYLAENGLNPDTYDGKTFLKDGDQPLSLKSFEQQNGYVVENRANGTVKIYLNADAAPRATLGHELYHSILRNSVMKDYYAQAVKEKVIGTRDAEGNLTNRGAVDIKEVKEMFRRYLDAEFKDPSERADAQARLEMAEKAYEDGGQLVSDPALGGRPLLEHLSEEFGAYYFSHLVMDKPIDWLYHGGDLPGIRGVLDNAKSLYQNYWRSRMNMSAPEFDFSRTFVDENGFEKLVPIDEVFAPAARDMFGNITGKTKRIVNPAMDLFFRDMLRIEKKVNQTGQFDITKMDKQTQQRYIDSEGLDGIFTKDQFGNYQHSTEAQIKRENKVKGKAVYQLLMGIPEAERTFVIDADGNIRGHLTPQMLDNIVNSGHMTRAMANKISLFQSISRGEAAGNIVDFGGIGGTAERPMDVDSPSRLYGGRVPYKSRTAVVFGLETVIGKNGKFQFKGNMLDYKVIETRANNEWSNADVQRLWNGNHTEYLADFYRYLENASRNHDNPDRKPSAELWTDGKGSERRNVLHQVLGMAKGEADTYLNSPKAEINRNAYSTVMSFSLNRMTNLRLRNQSVPFKFENAYRDLVRNWSPAEMDSELTPRGKIFKHPSGYRFVQREDNKTDAFDELNKRIGTYHTAAEATEAGRRHALKHPSTVLLKDNMTDNTVINRSPNQGEGEVPYRGGDDYWKPEGNIFEYKDEQGLIVRRPVVGDKRNPDNVVYMEIGHGWQRGNKPVASESYMWGYNDKNVDNSYVDNNSGWQLKKFNLDGNNKAHEQLAKFQTSSYQGRIELPENGQKGRISILDKGFRDDPEISLKKAKNIKEALISRIQKQLKKEGSDVVLNPEDFDAYLFYPSKEVKASFGLGKKDKLPVRFSPNEGTGELPAPPREYPIYTDSIVGIGKYELPQGSEPYPFRDVMDFTSLIKQDIPDPSKHSLWQFLDWQKRYGSKLKIDDVLKFIQNQGISVHSNVQRGYLSQWAEALRLFAQNDTRSVVIESGFGKDKGWFYDPNTKTVQFNKEYNKRGKAVKRDGGDGDAGDADDADGEAGVSSKKIKTDSRTPDIADADSVTNVSAYKGTYIDFHLNLDELIEKAYKIRREESGRQVAWNKKEGKNNATIYPSKFDRYKPIFRGASFEGTALEEIGHALMSDPTDHGTSSDAILKKVLDKAKGSASGDAWKVEVEKLISINEERVRNGLYVDPVNLAWTRLLKIQREVAKNLYVTNGKSVTSLWDSKGVIFNGEGIKGVHHFKDGYEWAESSVERNAHTIYDAGKDRSPYRFQDPQEFVVSLFNDPTALSRMALIEASPELLEGLRNKNERLLPNEEKLSEELSKIASMYLSKNRKETYSIANQLIEEVVSLMALTRREKVGQKDISKNKVLKKFNEGEFEPKERPVGVTTKWEKWYIQQHRIGLEAEAKANGTINPLDGLSDYEAWQELKKDKYQNPKYYPFAPQKTVNPNDREASSSFGVNVGLDPNAVDLNPDTGDMSTDSPQPIVTPDTGVPDTGVPDTGVPDTGVPDTGVPDTGGESPVIGIEGIIKPLTPPKTVSGKPPTGKPPAGKPSTTPSATSSIPPAPIPKRTFTDADIRVWRSWKTETYGNSSALKNALGYVIMSLNKNYRVYNPQRVLIGIYKDEEEAKRRVQREEPKR